MSTNLEMQINKTTAGLYTVTYGRQEAPLDIQEEAFAANGLEIVSLTQLGFLKAKAGKGTFNPYSRTNTDVLYDNRHDQVVVVPNGAISKLVGIANLVDAHRRNKECVIPEDQRDLVYDKVEEMLRDGTAFTANHGRIDVNTSEFGQTELTSKLFSDERLETNAQEYGDFMKDQGIKTQSIFFNDVVYAKSQGAPHVNKLRVYGPNAGFDVFAGGLFLDRNEGAFGVRFEKNAEGRAKK